MEIGALSSSPATSHFPRAAAADGAAERKRQVSLDSAGTLRGQPGEQNTVADPARNTSTETARKEAHESRGAQKADASAISSSPRTQFKYSEGTRVMEVYDSKSVLIYQVPSKGLLALIHSQDKQYNPQVETSA